jgi:hypothetical protein
MKHTMLQLHKEVTLHEKGMTPRKVQSALLVPQISKSTTMTNPQMEPIKT